MTIVSSGAPASSKNKRRKVNKIEVEYQGRVRMLAPASATTVICAEYECRVRMSAPASPTTVICARSRAWVGRVDPTAAHFLKHFREIFLQTKNARKFSARILPQTSSIASTVRAITTGTAVIVTAVITCINIVLDTSDTDTNHTIASNTIHTTRALYRVGGQSKGDDSRSCQGSNPPRNAIFVSANGISGNRNVDSEDSDSESFLAADADPHRWTTVAVAASEENAHDNHVAIDTNADQRAQGNARCGDRSSANANWSEESAVASSGNCMTENSIVGSNDGKFNRGFQNETETVTQNETEMVTTEAERVVSERAADVSLNFGEFVDAGIFTRLADWSTGEWTEEERRNQLRHTTIFHKKKKLAE
jgi:hypothetical protein